MPGAGRLARAMCPGCDLPAYAGLRGPIPHDEAVWRRPSGCAVPRWKGCSHMNYMDQYRKWLNADEFDAATVAELKALEGNDKEIEDRFYTELEFGTAGMRGVIGAGLNRMNVYNVRRATLGLADYINRDLEYARRGVAIAYDSRRFSTEFAEQAALVLCAQGVKAYLFESLRPVPVLSYAVRKLGAIAGIVITASHNPPQYNGYKVYWEDGGQMPPERAGEVLELIRARDFAQAQPMDRQQALDSGLLTIIGKEIDDPYIEMVKSLCVQPELMRKIGPEIKIVYTPLHGSGNIPVRRVLREIGFTDVRVVPEQELPDPNFSTVRVPNPEDPAAFTMALKLADEVGADLVFGTDPDCDRVGIAVRDGEGATHILTGNQTGCLLLDYVLSRRQAMGKLPANGAAVKSIVSTEMARAICKHYGVAMIDVLTGFKFIAEQIQHFEETGEHTFLFGFEESYGYLSGTQVRDKDGVNASMLIAETAAWYKTQGMTLYDALQSLFKKYGYYGEKVTSFALAGKDGLVKMRELMTRLREQPPREFAGIKVTAVRDYKKSERVADGAVEALTLPKSDVLYYEMEGGRWICVRPSGTEPKVKLYVNSVSGDAATTASELEAMSSAAVKLLDSLL